MTYGRLDVFWPDGKFETFTLEAPNVSLGRSSGNTITLETDTISRYHFSITQQGDLVQLTDLDSANGTFVDGARLESNTPKTLQGGEEIVIGQLRMIYHAEDDMPTLPMSSMAEDTQKIERETVGFRLEAYGPEISVPPGSHTFAEVTITNTSETPRRFTVRASGLPDDWLRVNRPELEITGGESASVTLNIKPFRASDSAPGSYTIRVVVALKDDPNVSLEAEIPVRILPYGGFGMALSANRINSGEPFRLHVHNQGSAGLPLFITGRSKNDQLSFGIGTPQLILAPGQRQIIQGEIKPRRSRLFGAPRDYTFDLLVRSRDDASFLAAIPGHFVERPVLPGWAALAVGALSLGVLALVVLGAILLLTASPRLDIRRFEANTITLPQGQPLILSWDVTGADSLTVRMDGTGVQTLSPEISTLQIDTLAYSGAVLVELVAFRENDQVSESLTVNIEEVLRVEYFELSPSTLVRNVVQDITIRWRVNGAETTRLTGLEAFSTTPLNPTYDAEVTLAGIAGVAMDSFDLRLSAEDAEGVTLEQVLTVDVIDPTCAPTNESLTLYALPNPTANVVSTVPRGTTLVVNRRDVSGAWIRVQLAGGVSAWGARTELTCAETFNPDALLAEVIAPTITPTAGTPGAAPATAAPVTGTPPTPTRPAPAVTPRPTQSPLPPPTVRP